MKPELKLHKEVAEYLQEFYPSVYFLSDPSGLRVSMHTARILKATSSSHSHLDVVVLRKSRQFSFLIIELKSDTPYKQNGELKSNEHLESQKLSMDMLEAEGALTMFAWSIGQVKDILHNYLGQPVTKNEPLFP